jgi:translocation and assembly module TamB
LAFTLFYGASALKAQFKKTFKTLVFTFCAFMLIAILLVSPWGTRLILTVAQSNVAGLDIEYGSGGLGSTLHLERLSWTNDLTQLEVQALSLNLNWACSMSFRLCLSELSAGKIDVRVAGSAQAAVSSSPMEKLTLPVPVVITSLVLNNISVAVLDTIKVEIASVNSRLKMFQTLGIDFFSTQEVNIILPKGGQADAQKTPTLDIAQIANWQYKPTDLPTFSLPLTMNAKSIEISDLSIFEQQREIVAIDKIVTAITTSRKKIKVAKLLIQHSKGDLSLRGELDSKLRSNLSADLNLYQYQNFTQPLHIKVAVKGSPENLSVVVSSKGQLEFDAQLSADLNSKLLPLSGDISWQNLAWPLTQPGISSAAGKITLQGNMNEYALIIDADMVGESFPLTQISANVKGNNQQVKVKQLHARTLDGEIDLSGVLIIDEQLKWQGELDFRQIKPQLFWPQLAAELNGSMKHEIVYDGEHYQLGVARLTTDGSWQDYALSASGRGLYDSLEGLDVPEVLIKSGDNTLKIEALIGPKHDVVASLDLTAANLGQLYPSIGGQSIVKVDVSGTVEEPAMTFTVDGQDIRLDGISLSRLNSEGKLLWNEEKNIELKSQVSNAMIAKQSFENIDLTLKGKADHHTLNLALQSGSNKLETQLSGQLDRQMSKWSGNWEQGQIRYSQGGFNLVETNPTAPIGIPILVDWQHANYRIGSNCWQSTEVESSKICIALADYQANNIDFDITAANLPVLTLLTEHFPLLASVKTGSLLNFDLSGNWPLDAAPQVEFKASLSPSQWILDADKTPIALSQFSFSALTEKQTNSDQLNVRSSLKIQAEQLGEVSANINLHTTPSARNLSGDISLNSLQLSSLQSFVPQLEIMQGDVNARVDIAGTLESPLVNGQVNLIGGLFAGQLLPANINHVNQTLTLAGRSATLEGPFQLGNGPGEVRGTLDWRDELSGSLQITGNKMEIDYQNIVRAQVSPDLQIEFAPQLIKLAGQVTVPYARVRVRELPPNAISPSKDVIVLNKPEYEKVKATTLALKVQLVIDPSQSNEVKLDAFGLTSELQGSLLLSNKNTSLSANGEVSLINGRYKAYGQNLLIRQGDIRFSGPIDNPYLTIEAVRDPIKTEDNVVAGVRVEGSTELPKVSIFSEPVMEQKEALSYLLRGKKFNSEGGTANDTILASALIGFGLGQSESQINKVGQKLGLEDLALDASGEGDQTKLSVSGYIAPGVQLRYGIGVFDSASEVALRYQISPKLYVEAVSGLNNALDIYYQFSRTSKEQSATTP